MTAVATSSASPLQGLRISTSTLTAAAVLTGLLAVMLPPFFVGMPPVVDYPNHYVRMWLIAGGADEAPLNLFYLVDWSRTATNIAIDLAAAAFGPVLGIERLGPLLLALSFVLPPLGAVVLNRTLFGGWHWWQIGFAALAWCATSLLGFMNFQLGLGVALLAAAADPALRRRGLATAVIGRIAFGAALVLFHPFDVVFYAAMIGGSTLGPAFNLFSHETFSRIRAGVLHAVPALVPLALALGLAPVAPGAEADGLPSIVWNWSYARSLLPFTGISSYGSNFDNPVLLAALWVPALAAARKGLSIHKGLLLTAGLIMALSYLVPYKIGDTYYTDYRLPIMAWLLAAASLRPDFGQRRAYAAAVGVGLLALVLTRTACVQWIWTQRQVDVQAVREATAPVPPGAKVLPVVHLGPESQGRHAPLGRFPGGNVSFWHYAVLVIPDRQAFAPSLFTAAGKQPVSVRAAYARMDSPNSPVVGIGALRKPYDQIPASIDHVRGWREEFDYILVLNADLPEEGIRDPRVPGLDPVTDTGFAQLFRVRKVSSAS